MEAVKTCLLSPASLCCVAVFLIHLQTSLAGDCPADGRTWVPFGQRCYHFVHEEEDNTLKSYSFAKAESFCQGFELVTVQSAEETAFILDYCPTVWKGNTNIWLGMYFDTNANVMKWLGEQPLNYTNWESSSAPSDLVPADTCVALHSNTGRWETASCQDDVENGVICEAAQKPAEERKPRASPVLSALVVLSVVAIMGVSAGIWFLHQKHDLGTTVFTAFEYHPPFTAPGADQSCLVDAEETNDTP